MKSGKEHRVALSKAAVAILSKLAAVRRSDFIFSGVKAGRPLSERALAMLLLRMKIDATPHGFRSSFRDWCGNETNYPGKSPKPHWRTRSAMPPSAPTDAATRWRNAGR